ncbi:hypothetical protein [Bdellovibrio reynosensis]|uniref:Sigma-54 factor interaction domain-containing protein n=1 Tax=Bdellovibrio reynosensis TaxID=2835041 RepID=A0ABY4C9G9_9BACT|nr:hypothetical protein [Bdellovibrio reynosensis]UOF00542.1 hypothetical protein MNR06_12620 [Bdellovibrio reynosensis]
MQHSTLDSSFVNRLKQILASRYGKGLQIRQLMDLAELSSEDVYTRGRDLHIPIKVNGSILGTAVVPAADDLNAEKRQGVTQLVRMVLEPAMYKWYLDQRESNLAEITKAQVNLDNVRLFGEDPLPSIDEILKEDEAEEPNEGLVSDLVSHLIHLQGRSENTNKKVALQLHELTGRWAFVPFNDIKGQLHSAHDIAKLGAMTIYIENAENLNAAEQELLMDYINDEPFADEPLIITSSSVPLADLGSTTLTSNMIDEITVNCFEVDRAPLSSAGLKEVLELFFIKDSPIDA